MKTKANVFFTIDKRFVQHFAVTITSLLENNRDLALTVYVINDIDDKTDLNKVLDFVKQKYNADIQLLSFRNECFVHYRVSYHLSRAVYFRLLLPDIIPASVDKGLFLDADIVVTGSIKPLFELEFKDNYLFAANDDELETNIAHLNKLGFPATRYFNAGVMLINLKAWREANVAQKLLTMADQYMQQLRWWDQDLLNMLFYDKWAYFDQKYNALALKKALPELPVIIHYTTSSKPWHYLNLHPYKDLYWKYLRLTPFKNSKPENFTVKNFFRKRYRILKGIRDVKSERETKKGE